MQQLLQTVTIPVGVKASLYVPLRGKKASNIVVSEAGVTVWQEGKFHPVAGVTDGNVDGSYIVFSVSSGSYSFSSV